MRGFVRGVTLVGLAGLAVGVFAPAARAHAVLVRSDPSNGTTVATSPSRVTLWFNEDISTAFSSARLVEADGRSLPGAHPDAGAGDPRRLIVDLPDLAPGAYGVMWRVLAEDDGHTTSGVVVFSVGRPGAVLPIAAGPGSPIASPIDVTLRWLGICLLAGFVGGLGVVLLVLGRAGSARLEDPVGHAIASARHRILTVAFLAAALAAGLGVATVLAKVGALSAQTSGSPNDALGHLLWATRWGHLWLGREMALFALAGVMLAMRPQARLLSHAISLGLQLAAAALVFAIAVIEALGSHAASLDSGRPAALAADSLHVLTGLLWLGALPAIVVALWPKRAGGAGRAALVQACRRPFTRLAVASVGLVVATGLYGAGREVETVHGLTSTQYGRTLLVKSGLLLVVGGIGLVNSARLHGWRPPWFGPARHLAGGGPSRRLIMLQAGVGALLLLAAGVLADTPPAKGPVVVPAPAATQELYRSVDDLLVTVSVTPNRPGVNGFTVLAASSRRPPPAPIEAIVLRLDGNGTSINVPLQQVPSGRYFGTATLGTAGRWQATVIVRRIGERLAVPLAWSVAPPASARLVPPSGRRLAPFVDALAVLLIVALITGSILWSLRQRRPLLRPITGSVDEAPADRVLEGVP